MFVLYKNALHFVVQSYSYETKTTIQIEEHTKHHQDIRTEIYVLLDVSKDMSELPEQFAVLESDCEYVEMQYGSGFDDASRLEDCLRFMLLQEHLCKEDNPYICKKFDDDKLIWRFEYADKPRKVYKINRVLTDGIIAQIDNDEAEYRYFKFNKIQVNDGCMPNRSFLS